MLSGNNIYNGIGTVNAGVLRVANSNGLGTPLANTLVATGATLEMTNNSLSGEPVTIGVSGPLTGQNAQYGAQWKKGFDLALAEVNVKGVKGRPLQYVFEDSQADPRQLQFGFKFTF